MKKRLEFIAFQLLKWLVLAMPLRSTQRLGSYLGTLAYYIVAGRRRIALDNLRHAFPEKSDRELQMITKGAFRNFAICFVELLWFPNLTDGILGKLVTLKNPEIVLEAHRRGRGIVLLAGHFGNWELIAIAVGRLMKDPIAVLVQTQNNELVDAVINRHRRRFGNRIVPRGLGVREIIRTLQGGGVVAIAPDQSGPIEGPFVEFFGRRVSAHQGPAVFALRVAAPMFLGYILRLDGGNYEIIFEEVPMSDLGDHNEQTMLELTQRYTTMLEKYIRKYPDQWLWLHRRWKHTLDGEQGEVGGRRSAVPKGRASSREAGREVRNHTLE